MSWASTSEIFRYVGAVNVMPLNKIRCEMLLILDEKIYFSCRFQRFVFTEIYGMEILLAELKVLKVSRILFLYTHMISQKNLPLPWLKTVFSTSWLKLKDSVHNCFVQRSVGIHKIINKQIIKYQHSKKLFNTYHLGWQGMRISACFLEYLKVFG